VTYWPDASAVYTGTYDTTEVGGAREADFMSVSPVWSPEGYQHPEGVADLEAVAPQAPSEAVEPAEAPVEAPGAVTPKKTNRRPQKAKE
jgi:hypothetical protein